MIYTIGPKEGYLADIAKYGTIQKVGRGEVDGEPYDGGIACLTFEDAQAAIREWKQSNFAVFGLLADWDTQTMPSKAHRWHDLLVDSDIVLLDEQGNPLPADLKPSGEE